MEVFISASKVSSRDRIGLDESLTLNPDTPLHFSKQTSKTFSDSLPKKNEMLQTIFYFHTLVMPNNHEYCDYNEVESSIKMFYIGFILVYLLYFRTSQELWPSVCLGKCLKKHWNRSSELVQRVLRMRRWDDQSCCCCCCCVVESWLKTCCIQTAVHGAKAGGTAGRRH